MADATNQLTLLSEFPVADLSIGGHPAEFVERTLMEKRGPSLHDDLAKQVKANNIRIAVLEERNDYLRQALARYEESSSLVPSDIVRRLSLFSLLLKFISANYIYYVLLHAIYNVFIVDRKLMELFCNTVKT